MFRDFARRLAEVLHLPFYVVLDKTDDREEQKKMDNSVQQVRNIDGSLAVNTSTLPAAPVLLVDDMVDSKWTLTVAAYLLTSHGSGPVYPLALALTGHGRMIPELSSNSQGILLLTAPLVAGRGEPSPRLTNASAATTASLAFCVKDNGNQLISSVLMGRILYPWSHQSLVVIESMLCWREVFSSVKRWDDGQLARSGSSVELITSGYPRRLKSRLREDAPPILYGCGDSALVEHGGLAVVGSRHVDEALTSYTEELGRIVAGAKRTLISGAAKGIDKAAMHGALQAGGSVIGVMADSLERAALARDNREPLMDQRLVFISAYDPAAGFNVGHAMQRNKVIYAICRRGTGCDF